MFNIFKKQPKKSKSEIKINPTKVKLVSELPSAERLTQIAVNRIANAKVEPIEIKGDFNKINERFSIVLTTETGRKTGYVLLSTGKINFDFFEKFLVFNNELFYCIGILESESFVEIIEVAQKLVTKIEKIMSTKFDLELETSLKNIKTKEYYELLKKLFNFEINDRIRRILVKTNKFLNLMGFKLIIVPIYQQSNVVITDNIEELTGSGNMTEIDRIILDNYKKKNK